VAEVHAERQPLAVALIINLSMNVGRAVSVRVRAVIQKLLRLA